ncbi:UNVERIFIED_CONTAM: ATP-binding cassette domain-containing protein, partial [Bacillus sp. ATCC 13368]
DNAAGKSTLARMIAGVYPPSRGRIVIDGEPVTISSTSHAHQLGIATVFQELALCDNLDVTANIFLGNEMRTSH